MSKCFGPNNSDAAVLSLNAKARAARPFTLLGRARQMRRLLAEHRCPGCEIRKDLCFCAEIPRVELQTQVILLMHTAEEVLTSNTARLTAQALANC